MAISSMCGLLSEASIVCSTTILPATLKNCLGMDRPKRLPIPPANTIAIFFSFLLFIGGLCKSSN